MWQPRARPCRRSVLDKAMLRPAGDVANNRRIDIAIPEFRADHFVALTMLDIGDANEICPGLGPFGRVVADIRLVERAPYPPPHRRITRRADIAVADLPPLLLVGAQQIRPAPAFQRAGEFPGE